MKDLKNGLHWTTILSEKLIIAIIGICTLFAVGDYPMEYVDKTNC